MLKKILDSQTKTERAETLKHIKNMNNENTIKEQLNDSEENARLTAVLRDKLKADIKKRGLSAYSIRSGKQPNPYPIGTRAVHKFANDYENETISNAQKWLMFIFFEQQDETEQAKNADT